MQTQTERERTMHAETFANVQHSQPILSDDELWQDVIAIDTRRRDYIAIAYFLYRGEILKRGRNKGRLRRYSLDSALHRAKRQHNRMILAGRDETSSTRNRIYFRSNENLPDTFERIFNIDVDSVDLTIESFPIQSQMILGLIGEGLAQCDISRRTGIPQSTISDAINRVRESVPALHFFMKETGRRLRRIG